MGCCGCDNKSSVNTAGIFSIVQCIIGVSLAIYNLNIFKEDCSLYGSKGYICYVLYDQTTTIRAMLIVAIVLYILWTISSIILLVGNAQNKVGYLRQWVGLSTVVIICDIVFPVVVVATTYRAIIDRIYDDVYTYRGLRYNFYDSNNLAWDYIGLLVTFSRGGLITWCCDIALTVYVSHRARDITNPPATYVYNQAFPTTTVVTSNFPPQYIQQGFVAPQQGYMVQAQQGYVGQPQQGYVVQPQGHNYYQPTQFNQPQNVGSNNLGPPPEYGGSEK